MEDILVKYEAYSGYAFKGLDSDKDAYGIEQLLLEDVHGIKGKIKYTGSETIIEHGFTGSFAKYSFITENMEIRSLSNHERFKVIG